MAKLAIFFLVAVAFQATLAIPTLYEDNTLLKYLDEIRTEVRDITEYIEKDFPEDHLALKAVTWQCHKLVEAIEVIINKLSEETFTHETEGLTIFREVISLLKEVRDSLKEVTLYKETTDIYQLKKNFIVSIKLVLERFEKLVHLTYKLYPEFQYTLKYLFVDFMTTLHGIRSHFIHINQGFEVVKTPRVLIKEIHEYTHEVTEIFKEFVHPSQLKVALREYLLYVNEIVRKLQDETILGHKEIDVVLHHLTNKLREIVFPIMEIMTENTVDIKVFRTKIITHLYEVVSIFEQLVQLCEDKVLPVELRTLLIRVIYHYFYAIKHVTYETSFGNKIGFYTPKYYSTEYYGKHGYGLYEREFHHRFYTPYKYETKYYNTPLEYHNMEYTPYRYETLFPVRKFEMESIYGKTHETLFPVRKFEMEPIYGKTHEWNKYYSGMKYESPKDLVLTIRMLVKRIFERFQQNTWEVTGDKTVLFHNIREFITVLDYILEKFETKITFERTLYTEKYIEEFIYTIKEIKHELREIISSEYLINLPELKTRFLHHVEYFSVELCKLIEKYQVREFESVVSYFVTFLRKLVTYTPEYYSTNTITSYMPRYYNPITRVPHSYMNTRMPFRNTEWNTERFVPNLYNRLY